MTTPPTWADQARGLYDEDLSFWEIGKRLVVRPSAVYNYARRQHWPRRTCDDERYAKQKVHPAEPSKVKRFARGEPTLPPLASLQ
jgi:hypothetical protein